jgi:hypothetical protein
MNLNHPFCKLTAKILVFLMIIQGWPLWELSRLYTWQFAPEKLEKAVEWIMTLGPAPAEAADHIMLATGGKWFDSGSDHTWPGNPNFTFEVAAPGDVYIGLNAENTDAVLHLLDSGDNLIASAEDNIGEGATIQAYLPPGLYTVVAATETPGQSGSFVLDVTGYVKDLANQTIKEISYIHPVCTGKSDETGESYVPGINCFTCLSDWESAKQEDLVAAGKIAVARIEGEWTVADTRPLAIGGWTTNAGHYIRIVTSPESRHDGKWNEKTYRLQTDGNAVTVKAGHVEIDGLQVHVLSENNKAVYIFSDHVQKTAVRNNILVGNFGQDSQQGIFGSQQPGSHRLAIQNNIIYNFNNAVDPCLSSACGTGINIKGPDAESLIANNTVYNCNKGIRGQWGGTARIVNNAVFDCTNWDYNGGGSPGSVNNVSSDGTAQTENGMADGITGAQAAGNFVDPAGNNFHIKVDAPALRNKGVYLPGDATDIDGETRHPASWDIGADEFSKEISYIHPTCSGQSSATGEVYAFGINCFTCLSDWESAKQENLVAADKIAVARIEGSWSDPETNTLGINGWQTDAAHYIRILTSPESRHDGKWKPDAYRMATDGHAVVIKTGHVEIEGLQIQLETDYDKGFYVYSDQVEDISIHHNIIRGAAGKIQQRGISTSNGAGSHTLSIYNNIIYDFNNPGCVGGECGSGIYITSPDGHTRLFNNTVYNCNIGIRGKTGGTAILMNNAVFNSSKYDYFSDGASPGSTNNVSSDLTAAAENNGDADMANGITGAAAQANLIDPANNDFHIKPDAPDLKDNGVDLSLDFTDDIDGNPRHVGAWDVGADEFDGIGIFPEIKILTPSTGAQVQHDTITVSGETRNNPDHVVVNNVHAEVSDNTFRAEHIFLKPGINIITAVSLNGSTIDSDTIKVDYQPVNRRITDESVALYTFKEGSGDRIYDVSGSELAPELRISDPSAVEWLPSGGIKVNASTLIASDQPAYMLSEYFSANDVGITIEAWIKPTETNQTGPARIVTLSVDDHNRHFTFGQNGSEFDFRVRTGETDNNGIPSLSSGPGFSETGLTHVAYTLDDNESARIYINGQEVISREIAGSLSNWDADCRLGLANEMTGSKPWIGEYYMVAIYAKALSGEEVERNFSVGPDFIIDPKPEISITSHFQGQTTQMPVIDVAGEIRNYPDTVTVNGIEAQILGDTFEADNVPLVLGENLITAIAGNTAGTDSNTVAVFYSNAPGPACAGSQGDFTITMDTPVDGKIIPMADGPYIPIKGTISNIDGSILSGNITVAPSGWGQLADNMFSGVCKLIPGENIVYVSTELEIDYGTYTQHRNADSTLCVQYGVPGAFEIGVNNPVNGETVRRQNLNVSGHVSDPSSVVTVNGTPASVLPGGDFSLNLMLEQYGENPLPLLQKRAGK